MLLSVNVGQMRRLKLRGKTYETGIWKFPAEGPLKVSGVNLQGDEQGDQSVHGGRDKALYCYAREDYRWWEEQLGTELPPGAFGENLTISGIDVTSCLIGERWRAGTTVLQVTQPRQPCWKLGRKMGDPAFPRRFSEANRPGAYLRIVREGEVGKGDPVEVIHRPLHPVTVGLIACLTYRDRRLASWLKQLCELDMEQGDWEVILSNLDPPAYRQDPRQCGPGLRTEGDDMQVEV